MKHTKLNQLKIDRQILLIDLTSLKRLMEAKHKDYHKVRHTYLNLRQDFNKLDRLIAEQNITKCKAKKARNCHKYKVKKTTLSKTLSKLIQGLSSEKLLELKKKFNVT